MRAPIAMVFIVSAHPTARLAALTLQTCRSKPGSRARAASRRWRRKAGVARSRRVAAAGAADFGVFAGVS